MCEGKASAEQLAGFAIEHRDGARRGEYMARGSISMLDIDREAAAQMAEIFAEQALGLFTKTAGTPSCATRSGNGAGPPCSKPTEPRCAAGHGSGGRPVADAAASMGPWAPVRGRDAGADSG